MRSTSAAYTEDFNEVKELRALHSSKRTADETAAAVFWQFAPIALWNPLARNLAGRYGLDTADQARLYAMINLARADAAIACWNDKYLELLAAQAAIARPTPTAIRRRAPTRAGRRCSRRRRPRRRPSPRLPSPTTRPVTDA